MAREDGSSWPTTQPDFSRAIEHCVGALDLDPKKPIPTDRQVSVLAPLVERILGKDRSRDALAREVVKDKDKVPSYLAQLGYWLRGTRNINSNRLAELFAGLYALCDGDADKENDVVITLDSLFPVNHHTARMKARWLAEHQVCAIVPLLKDNSLVTLLDVAEALRKADSSDFGSAHPTEDVPLSYPLRMESDAVRLEALADRLNGMPD